MPLAGFEPMVPVFKRAKTFHALDRTATVTGMIYIYIYIYIYRYVLSYLYVKQRRYV
jgi:hypothetical protein